MQNEPNQKEEIRFLSPNQAALLLGKSRTTVMKWINDGRLQYQKSGRKHLIPITTVEAIIANPDLVKKEYKPGRKVKNSPKDQQLVVAAYSAPPS